MPGTPGHPGSPFAGITDDVLFAWAEGELSNEQAAELAARHPRALALISQLRRDRAVHASIPFEKAPADMADRVVFALEREALLGLADGSPTSDSLPISRVPRRREPSRHQHWWRSTPRMALAAGIALVISGGTLLILRSGGPGNSVAPMTSDGSGLSIAAKTDDRRFDDFATPAGTIPAATNAAAESTSFAMGAPTLASEPAIADAADADVIDASRALALAHEGRLGIRISSTSAAALARIDTARSGQAWKVLSRLSDDVAMSLAPAQSTFEPPRPVATPIALASRAADGDQPSPTRVLHPRELSPLSFTRPAPPAYSAEVLADAGTLVAMRDALAKLAAGEAEFFDTGAPVALARPTPPQAVLWWTQPPETWAPRIVVPIVAERE